VILGFGLGLRRGYIRRVQSRRRRRIGRVVAKPEVLERVRGHEIPIGSHRGQRRQCCKGLFWEREVIHSAAAEVV
jgi:hypothetical protein